MKICYDRRYVSAYDLCITTISRDPKQLDDNAIMFVFHDSVVENKIGLCFKKNKSIFVHQILSEVFLLNI